MFIKVHKESGKWIRHDNKKSIGKEVPPSSILEKLKMIFGNHIFAIENQKISVIYYGYIKDGKFIFLCEDRECKNCPKIDYFFCRRRKDKMKDKTCGYYILE